MSDIIAGVIGGIGSIGVDIWNAIQAGEQKDWERKKYQEMLAREDSAVQRRALDMKAAGLSKTLAAGGAASTSMPIKSNPPELKSDPLQMMAIMQQLKQTSANISKTVAEKKLIDQQRHNSNQDMAIKNYNWEWFKNFKWPTSASVDSWSKIASLLQPFMEGFLKERQTATPSKFRWPWEEAPGKKQEEYMKEKPGARKRKVRIPFTGKGVSGGAH